ncbi:eukaryotic translation initiation factor 3 subunit H [Ascobolus immersus RN42]|uniref:Eukaryotic translation initiation factor 3 subunit H n=1 Tax=Ascobolus immersus RN42 TaxID=1160509 RepID=A0A3N4I7B8_ASCIM|nr:eukaryotic translation initiation factor 3 subunit H [Ascobolus immersus RN42]
MADKVATPPTGPLKGVRVDALVVMKITKHCASSHPTLVTGQLLGLEQDNYLHVTHSFAFPTVEAQPDNSFEGSDKTTSSNAAAPRAKSSAWYQTQMVDCLKLINVDANVVGWYQSANLGSFLNKDLVENQFFYQTNTTYNERTVVLVHDVAKSAQGSLGLRAFRLTKEFIAARKEDKFTSESLVKHKLTYQNILEEIPVTIHNSHLVTSFVHQLSTPPKPLPAPSLAHLLQQVHSQPSALPAPLYPNFDSLELAIDPFLEKTAENLLESIETHHTELNNTQYHQRQLAREQAKIAAWQVKRKAENVSRAATKQELLPEDEWQKLFKLPQEPSRLESLLNSRQIEQYAKQTDGFAATVSAKMFGVYGGLQAEM